MTASLRSAGVTPLLHEGGEATPVPVLLERDNHIPEFDELLAERARIQHAYDAALVLSEVRHA